MSARELIRNAVVTLARESGTAGPLAGITAAADLKWAAQDAVRTHARTAREDGATWAQIGAALGYQPGEGRPPAGESAFRVVASDLGSGGPCFPWTCPECTGTVLDYGPGAGSPEDQERGHGEGCARLAEAVRDWKAQWEDDGDDGQ